MPENDNSSSSGGVCPVAKDANVKKDGSSEPHSWSSWFGLGSKSKSPEAVAKSTPAGNSSSASGCPVDHQRPASLEESAAYSQDPHPDQKGVFLSTHRMISSIPRGATEEKGPHHQPTAAPSGHPDEANTSNAPSHWIYPSEQQFFHALRKKGWDHVEAETIPSVLEIHNTVNERTWKQVQEWEANMDLDLCIGKDGNYIETDLKLVRFLGRPKDLSPQAFVWTKLLRWSEPPFDRHDWFVQKQPRNKSNAAGVPDFPIQRYVIDYYMIPPAHPDMPPTPFMDARPALDGPRAFLQRGVRLLQEELPGLTSEYYAWKARQPRYYDGSLPTTTKKTSSGATEGVKATQR